MRPNSRFRVYDRHVATVNNLAQIKLEGLSIPRAFSVPSDREASSMPFVTIEFMGA